MITEQNTLVEIKAEAFNALRAIEQTQNYLRQLNQLIVQKEEAEKKTPEKEVAEPKENKKGND